MVTQKRKILVHVGLGQSGSTSLFSIFDDPRFGYELLTPRATREEVMFALFEGLEAGEFDPSAFRCYVQDQIEVRKSDRTPVISSEGLTRLGFFQKGLNLQVEAFAHRLKVALPDYDIKILLIVREQRSLFVSKYRKYVEKFGGNVKLAKFVRVERSRQYVPIDREHLYAGNFDYAKLYRAYASIFGAENVLVLPMEMMGSEPQEFLFRVSTLVQSKPTIDVDIPALNPHGRLGSTNALRLFNLIYSPISPSLLGFMNPHLVPDINSIIMRRKSFARAFTKIRNLVTKMVSSAMGRDRLKLEKQDQFDTLDAVLGNFFVESNLWLSRETSVDFSEYGYKTIRDDQSN